MKNPFPVILRFVLSAGLTLAGLQLAVAQPSGGPYGPIQLTYEPPADATNVYFVAPDGQADAAGTSVDKPTTIESAIAKVVTGDAIIMRGGTYRTGGLEFNQGITIQPYKNERPILKGTKIATEWESLRDGVWRTKWDTLFPLAPQPWWRREREGMRTPIHRFNNDMVFVDGKSLTSAGWEGELGDEFFYVNYETGHVYIGIDPADKVVEITAFDSAMIRKDEDVHGKTSDRKGPIIRGITMTQYAFRAIEIEGTDQVGVTPESEYGKDVVGTTLEHVTISHCSRTAGYFYGDGLVIRNCLISDTSTEGLFIQSANDVLLERNIVRRNNIEKITGYYPAAIKIYNQCHRVTCRDNLVLEQANSNGIWYDVGNVDGVFINNWIQDCYDGFFFEISKGAICAGNVFVNCAKGVRVLNSADVHVYHNTFVNTVASFERTTRSAVGDHFDWHPATGPGVEERDGHRFAGNLLTAREDFEKALLRFEQVEELCGKLTEPAADEVDHNVFVRQSTGAGPEGLIVWCPAKNEKCRVHLDSPAALHAFDSKFSGHDRYLQGYFGPLFRGPELARYDLHPDFPAANSDYSLPDRVRKLLGWEDVKILSPGAYQKR